MAVKIFGDRIFFIIASILSIIFLYFLGMIIVNMYFNNTQSLTNELISSIKSKNTQKNTQNLSTKFGPIIGRKFSEESKDTLVKQLKTDFENGVKDYKILNETYKGECNLTSFSAVKSSYQIFESEVEMIKNDNSSTKYYLTFEGEGTSNLTVGPRKWIISDIKSTSSPFDQLKSCPLT